MNEASPIYKTRFYSDCIGVFQGAAEGSSLCRRIRCDVQTWRSVLRSSRNICGINRCSTSCRRGRPGVPAGQTYKTELSLAPQKTDTLHLLNRVEAGSCLGKSLSQRKSV